MTITIENVPTRDIPGYKRATKELGKDMLVDPLDGEWATVHFVVSDYYDLLIIGRFSGTDSAYNSFKGPLGEMLMGLEQNINEYIQKNKDNDNKL